MSPDDLAYALRTLRRGEQVDLHKLLKHLLTWVRAGGDGGRAGAVQQARRDRRCLPAYFHSAHAHRVFWRRVNSIRVFNPLTQRSEKQAEAVTIPPVERDAPVEARSRRRPSCARSADTGCAKKCGGVGGPTAADRMGERFEGMELFAPYYTSPQASLADYLALWARDTRRQSGLHAPLLVLDDPDFIAGGRGDRAASHRALQGLCGQWRATGRLC